jgi:hypothetical protein
MSEANRVIVRRSVQKIWKGSISTDSKTANCWNAPLKEIHLNAGADRALALS